MNSTLVISILKKVHANTSAFFSMLTLILLSVSIPWQVQAQSSNPVPVQFFYVPLPEDQLFQVLQTVQDGEGTPVSNPMQTYISIAALASNTVIYYDQWENGFEPDIANPLNLYSATNPGGTQVWGDGDASNGAPPGVPSDIINAGTVIILNNPVNSNNRLAIDFDGGDKIAASKTIAVTRTGWGTGPNTLLAAANEVFDTDNWGTAFVSPVGENMPVSFDYRIFDYTGLSIMAGVGGASVQVDKDANGSYETNFTLAEGEARLINGGINVGAKILSTKPVQIELLTGDKGEEYETRFFGITPTNLLSNKYYTPVSTPPNVGGTDGTNTAVFLYNPNSSAITVNYTTRTGSSGNTLTSTPISIAAGGYAKKLIPEGYGASFISAGGQTFHALSATDVDNDNTSNGGNRTWDWGYTLSGEGSLTPQVLVGLGIGRDPTSSTNPNENGNPVWVTPIGNGNTSVDVFVDYDANPSTGSLTDPNGNKYDVKYQLRELDRAKIYDPTDRNQTGMLVYTLAPSIKLSAAWGQDPDEASAGAPGLDVGTGVPPVPLFDGGKNGTLYQDNDGDGFISPGDILEYKIVVNNISRAPVPDITVIDNLPAELTYIANTTYFKNHAGTVTQIPDGGGSTAFPLDGTGYLVNPSSALPVGGSYEVTFRATIKDFEDLPSGTVNVINTGTINAIGEQVDFTTITPLFGRIGDKVWEDLNRNGLQDPGEPGIQGVTVNLLDADGNVVATKTTDANGSFIFYGVLAGDYKVQFVNPSAYEFTTKNADGQGINGASNSDANAATGITDLFTLAGGQINYNVDAGMVRDGSIGDKVWEDTDGDGVQDAGEPGLANVTVKLYNSSNNLVATTTTNTNGEYFFTDVPAGSYYVEFTLLNDYTFSPKDQGGNDATDSDADPSTGKTATFTLADGENNFTLDAGMKPSVPGSIGDKVWVDSDADGVQDAGEPGLANVTVKLYDNSNNLVATTTTNSNGIYTFADVPAGSYYVEFTLPSNYVFSAKDQGGNDATDSDANTSNGQTAIFTIADGENKTSVDAGMIPNSPGSIGDKVWNDTDRDGIQDGGEAGLPGVTVNLYDCQGILKATTTTNANGEYTFSNVNPGSYYVEFILLPGYVFSPKDAGSNDAVDSDADLTLGTTSCFTLTSGGTINTTDAGMYLATADLEVTKSINSATINCGSTPVYTITVRNNGPADAGSVVVNDLLPAGLVFGSASATQGTYNSTTGDWTVGTLANGATATLTLNVTVDCNALNLSTNDLGPAAPFNLFVLRNLTQPSSDTEGKVAVGGNANLSNYSVGDKLPNSNGTEDMLVVGGNLVYTSGRVYHGNVAYGGFTNLPINAVSIEEGTLRHDNSVIDFAAATTYLEALSTRLAGYAANGTTTFQWGTISLNSSNPYLNVFTVNASDLNTAHTVEINVPNGSTVLVNILGTTVSWHGGLWINGTSINSVLFNFPDAQNITISGIDVKGSFLAPFADLNFAAGIITGQTIVKSMTGAGQFNLSPFHGNIPSNASVVNAATITGSNISDPVSTNNTASVTANYSPTSTGGGSGGSGNTNWQQIGNFPAGQVVTTLESDDQGTIYAGTASGYIYKSTNNNTWTHINPDVYSGAVWALKLMPNGNLLAATVTGVYIGANHGATWTHSSLQFKDVRNLKADNNGRLYAGTWGFGVFTSADNGATWTAVNNGLGSHLMVTGLTITPDNSVFAGTFSGGVFKTVNQGTNWSVASPSYQFIWTMAATTDGKLFAGTYGDGLYRSDDNGASWTKTFFPGSFVYELRIDAGNNIFATSYSAGVFLSTDNGNTWTSLGLGGFGLSSLLIVPNGSMADGSASSVLYTGTANGGIYMASSNVTGVKTEGSEVPTELNLGQNYPNPFNPSTMITVAIAKAGNYTMQVFDITGQVVATLMEGNYEAGNFKVEFNASNIPSGIYFYRLTGDNVNLTKKMILMK